MKGKEVVFNHPLINHKLSIMRNKDTSSKEFRELLSEIGMLMAYEITRDLPTKTIDVVTPITGCKGQALSKEVVIVPIMRAGMGMVDGILKLIPTAKVGHLGLYRDEETLEPKEYYAKFPGCIKDAFVILVDPMLATGGSVEHALDVLNKRGVYDIRYVGLVGAPEGIARVRKTHPEVDIYLAALDEKLNEIGYIVPGLGDCGDRIYGTK